MYVIMFVSSLLVVCIILHPGPQSWGQGRTSGIPYQQSCTPPLKANKSIVKIQTALATCNKDYLHVSCAHESTNCYLTRYISFLTSNIILNAAQCWLNAAQCWLLSQFHPHHTGLRTLRFYKCCCPGQWMKVQKKIPGQKCTRGTFCLK